MINFDVPLSENLPFKRDGIKWIKGKPDKGVREFIIFNKAV